MAVTGSLGLICHSDTRPASPSYHLRLESREPRLRHTPLAHQSRHDRFGISPCSLSSPSCSGPRRSLAQIPEHCKGGRHLVCLKGSLSSQPSSFHSCPFSSSSPRDGLSASQKPAAGPPLAHPLTHGWTVLLPHSAAASDNLCLDCWQAHTQVCHGSYQIVESVSYPPCLEHSRCTTTYWFEHACDLLLYEYMMPCPKSF